MALAHAMSKIAPLTSMGSPACCPSYTASAPPLSPSSSSSSQLALNLPPSSKTRNSLKRSTSPLSPLSPLAIYHTTSPLPSPKGSSTSWIRLMQEDVTAWTHEDVAKWVEIVGYGEYKDLFLHHKVTGDELIELSTEDLEALGIHSIGHLKRMVREIEHLLEMPKAPIDEDEDVPRQKHKRKKSKTRSRRSGGMDISSLEDFESDCTVVKCFHKGHDKSVVFSITSTWTLSDLKQRTFQEFNRHCSFSYINQLGYSVPIKNTWDFKDMIRNALPPVAIYCRSKELLSSSSSTSSSSSAVPLSSSSKSSPKSKSKSKSKTKAALKAARHNSSGCLLVPVERTITL